MKILLIVPAGGSVRVTREKRRVPRRKMLRFSLLPLTIVAALTPPEHEVHIVDENVEPLDFEEDADLVGITFMTALAPRAYEIAANFRAKGKWVVGGGYHPTLCSAEAAQFFDAIVVGDAEYAWPQLLEDVKNGRLQKIYMATPESTLATPIPWRKLPATTARHYVTTHAVQTGRGCIHGCRYCSVTAFHCRRLRKRALEDVLLEIRALPRDLIIVDDNIIADREYARELFRAMIPLRKRWVGQCSIEIADDPDLLQLASAAGCCGLFIGIETTSSENLAAMDKGFNESERYLERLANIRRAGIGVTAGIIVGLDGDSVEVFGRTLDFLQRARVDALQLNILTPLPGTPLFDDTRKAGRVTDLDWSHYDFRHVVFRPQRMKPEELQAGADWLYAEFYRLDRVLWRFAAGLFSLKWVSAWLCLRLGLTYRYDNKREHIVGWNPARLANLRRSCLDLAAQNSCP